MPGRHRPDALADADTTVIPAIDTAPIPAVALTTVPLPRPYRERLPFEPFTSAHPTVPVAVPGLVRTTAPEATAPSASSLAAPPSGTVAGTVTVPAEDAEDEGYSPTRRRTVVSRITLLVILALQTVLTLRLRNTAFEDEALYLYAGRMEIAHLLHGAALQGNFASYFSGSPVLYPVLGAALNMVGGLALARALSMVEMLAVTAMLYSMARFLFNERVALCSAALFAVSESALFVGHLATYDATCLFLLAAGATIVVRTSTCRYPVFMLAAPLVALAVAVKYAGALYVPTITVLPALAGWPVRGRRVLLYPVAFGAAVLALLALGLYLGGHVYYEAIAGTTTNRPQGTTPEGLIVRESLAWGGVVMVLAAIGAVAYAWRPRTEQGELIAPYGRRKRRVLLGAVLFGTVFLAPLYQMHLHTDVSLHKHIGFGMFFAAPVAGVGLVRIVGDHFRRPHFGVALWIAALTLGMSQSWSLYHAWPSSGPFVSALSEYLAPHAMYLVEVPEVPVYYLEGRADAQPDQFASTYSIAYSDNRGQVLTGIPGFSAAIRAATFRVIAYDGEVTPATDNAIKLAIKESGDYRLARIVHLSDKYGPVNYYIWVRHSRPNPTHHIHPAHHAHPSRRPPS